MSTNATNLRPRLTVVDGSAQRPKDPAPKPFAATPQVLLLPVDRAQKPQVCELAFELARALAAQTARTGAIVFADRGDVPRSRFGRRAKIAGGPLMGLRFEPLLERDGVLFFEPERAHAVRDVVRGQMPQVTIAHGVQSEAELVDAGTAMVIVVQEPSRPEYVELLRGELSADESRPVYSIELPVRAPNRFARRGPSPIRVNAWELAAEVVLD